MDRRLDHLLVQGFVKSEDFHRRGLGSNKTLRQVDRNTHGSNLIKALGEIFIPNEDVELNFDLFNENLRATGTIIVLVGEGIASPLKLDSLNAYSSGKVKKPKWLLLSVRADEFEEKAIVWVSDEFKARFLKLFEDYLDDEKLSPKGHPRNESLVANISNVRQAQLDDLWTSSGLPPRSGIHWWELWLDGNSPKVEDISEFIETHGLSSLKSDFRFGDRLIVWVQATWSQLVSLPFTSVPLTELRKPEFIDTLEDTSVSEQLEYVQDLATRVTHAPEDSPVVCLLDTGVMRTHVLLEGSLSAKDHHSIFGGSGTDSGPRIGHGTSMAGLALYGNLEPLLISSDKVDLNHRLESVRIYPSFGENNLDPLDFGTATATAVAISETGNIERARAFCLTLSTEPDQPGEPTLWSAVVDALALGTEIVREGNELQLLTGPDFDSARLILVAAGNVPSYALDYRTNSINSAIQDPAQAWNALTVGAYTEMVTLPSHPQYSGFETLSKSGDISPHTSTSNFFSPTKWPIKPDFCMEGGNVLSDGKGLFEDRLPVLSLRSTGHKNDSEITSANATSAATAQAARLASLAMGRYPTYWPETIRGLLTHSAEWTDNMREQLDVDSSKQARHSLLRQFGWGVCSEDAVLNSSQNDVTLVTQDEFVPFSGDKYSMRNFQLHPMPWPTEMLQELGSTEIRLRVTLSYFVEPNASRRGWRNKYTYSSHGLRFDLQGRTENASEFVRRVNRDAQDEEQGSRSTESDRWFLGEKARHLGSLHQDEWVGTAAELAHCNNVAVYPVGGWWKNNGRKDRIDLPVRYSLLLSLRAKNLEIDLYTPISSLLQVPVDTRISIIQ